jgi:transposase
VNILQRKSNSFHIEIQTHRKKPYGLLRNSYRIDGKVRHETICRFSGLTFEQLKAMQAALQNKTIMKDDLKLTQTREYGASFACVEIIKSLELHKDIFSRPAEEWVRACIAMIAGRLVFAGSKLALSHCSSYSELWRICGIESDIDVNVHCYDAMDRLFERQEAIQKKLVKKHLQNGTLVLYDITSCYMEGEYSESELVEFGYNRDKKRGHEQIVISLLCAQDGCPIAVEVLKGNRKDETTVLDKIKDLKDKYGIEKVVFVGDRGMITQSKYEKINHETTKVISALTHGAIKELLDKGSIQMSLFDEKDIVEVIDNGLRYCLCKNPEMAVKEYNTREALLKKTTEELDKIIGCTRKTKYSKEIRAGKVVNKYKMGKFINFEGTGENLKYMLNEVKIEQEVSLDGCYIVYTDVSAEDMTAVETVENYKKLTKVEQAFRNMKTVKLEVRPVFHRIDERIKCHVFICMLAYYVMWHMKQRLQPLFETDGKGSERKLTFESIIEELKCISKGTVEFCNTKTSIITTPSEEQQRILELLAVKL